MKNRLPFLLAVLVIVLLSIGLAQPAPPAEAQTNRQVWVYYMGFWSGGPSWDMQANVLTDYPLIGKYDSRDPGVAATQIDQARGAGIDAFLVSWFGLADQATTTPVLNNMLDRAAERGFRVAAVVDMFNPAFNRDRNGLINSLRWLVNDRANHPGYLRYNGRPVIVFAFQSSAGFSSSEWQSIRNQVDPNRTTLWIAEGLNGCCLYGGAMDGMYAFNLAWANGSSSRYIQERNAVANRGGTFYMPTVHPGWNENLIAARDNRPNPTSPRDRAGGQFLANSWNGAVTAGTDVILVVSWNEFMENSHIEPSVLYGTQSLDTLRPLIAAWKSGAGSQPSAPSGGSPTGQMIEANSTINVRSGPGTGYSIIGRISPGTSYAVLGQQNGWYAISFNGQTGYVAGWLVRVVSGGSASPPSGGSPTGQMIEANSTINVRSGPGTGYSVIGRISPGTSYAVLGQQNGWYAISFNGQTGYVAGWLVRVVSAPALPGGATISFTAGAVSIGAGQCTTLSWNVQNVQAVFLNGQGVIGQGSQTVCPTATTTYTLTVYLTDGTTTQRQITITVR